MKRRKFLKAAVAGIAPIACHSSASSPVKSSATARNQSGVMVNDVHSQLNETRVLGVVEERTLDGIRRVIRSASREGRAVSIAGGRHAMGGQQFGSDTLNIDTRTLSRVLSFDAERGLIEVEAGIQWPPRMPEFLRLKQRYDSDQAFQSDWYRHHVQLLGST